MLILVIVASDAIDILSVAGLFCVKWKDPGSKTSFMFLQMSKLSDTTAAQARRGKDIQGIPWDGLLFTREQYRETRLQQYKNYLNLQLPHDDLEKVTDTSKRFLVDIF